MAMRGGYQPKCAAGETMPSPPSGGSAAQDDVAEVMLAEHAARVEKAMSNPRVQRALKALVKEGVTPFTAQSCLSQILRGGK